MAQNRYVGGTALPARTKTIKVEIRTWDRLKGQKEENETFDDVIKRLLREKTVSLGDDNIKAIKYERKVAFFNSDDYEETIGFEFEYNDVKSDRSDFTLDLKVRKVFYRKRVINPSEFFGADNTHKHFSGFFLTIYLKAVALALRKEFRIEFRARHESDYGSIASWRQLYYDYSLSEESFREDIEEPLRLSEEEKIPEKWKNAIENSVSAGLTDEYHDSL